MQSSQTLGCVCVCTVCVLQVGGLFVLYNANYRLEDTSIGSRYQPVLGPGGNVCLDGATMIGEMHDPSGKTVPRESGACVFRKVARAGAGAQAAAGAPGSRSHQEQGGGVQGHAAAADRHADLDSAASATVPPASRTLISQVWWPLSGLSHTVPHSIAATTPPACLRALL